MMNKILTTLGLGDISLNAENTARRRSARFEGQQAEILVGNARYSVRDWSMSGLSFDTLPDSRLVVGDRVNFTLLFRFPHDTVTVQQAGRVVRTSGRGVAVEFLPSAPDSRRVMERVLDGFHARDFMQSQQQSRAYAT